jgi:hypothetical protein
MARTNKTGIGYFPFDVDFFNDEKIEYTSARFGIKGEIIAIHLLCKIYRNGYYTEWNDDESTLLAKRAGEGITPSLVSEVVKELVKRRFFDESLLNRFAILTSRGIQSRYFEATKRYQSVEVFEEFLLVDVSKMINVHINSINVYINPINANINSQKKGKEIEIEKEKENSLGASAPEQKDFSDSENFDSLENIPEDPSVSKVPDSNKKASQKKEKSSAKKEIAEREQDFYDELKAYLGTYPKEMLRDFYDYWSERDAVTGKMRREMQRTWETPKRLARWARNGKAFSKKGGAPEPERKKSKFEQNAEVLRELLQDTENEKNSQT